MPLQLSAVQTQLTKSLGLHNGTKVLETLNSSKHDGGGGGGWRGMHSCAQRDALPARAFALPMLVSTNHVSSSHRHACAYACVPLLLSAGLKWWQPLSAAPLLGPRRAPSSSPPCEQVASSGLDCSSHRCRVLHPYFWFAYPNLHTRLHTHENLLMWRMLNCHDCQWMPTRRKRARACAVPPLRFL